MTLWAVWRRHHGLFLCAGLLAMTAIGLLRWSSELWRLLIDRGPDAAIDLLEYRDLVAGWFAGVNVYSRSEHRGTWALPCGRSTRRSG